MEYINENAKKPTDATQVDAEELSFCNCENNACETPYQAEDIHAAIEEQDGTAPKDRLLQGYRKVKQACRTTANRIKTNWKQHDGGLRLKQTVSYRLDVYQSTDEETPVDHFYTEKTNTCALRTLLVAAAATIALMWCWNGIMGGRNKG